MCVCDPSCPMTNFNLALVEGQSFCWNLENERCFTCCNLSINEPFYPSFLVESLGMSWMSSVAGSSIEFGFAITDRSLRPDRFDDTARDCLEGKCMVKFWVFSGFPWIKPSLRHFFASNHEGRTWTWWAQGWFRLIKQSQPTHPFASCVVPKLHATSEWQEMERDWACKRGLFGL